MKGESRQILLLVTLTACGLFLAACSRRQSSSQQSNDLSVEQRVTDLQEYLDGNAPPMNEAEARAQYEKDLAEIQSIGLVERAQRDFTSRIAGATIEQWTVGYFRDTNTVWCDVRYRLPGGGETLYQGFGYTRKTGTNWSLMWGGRTINGSEELPDVLYSDVP